MGILRADARQIPLIDGCVQAVVTSPPYWDLRDYGVEPTAWGGNPICPHEWGPKGSSHRGGPQGVGGQRLGRDTSAQDETADRPTGCWCGLCGAWRGCLGLEPTPDLYVEHMVEVFREVARVLRNDGVLWLNLGDCYATGAGAVGEHPGGGAQGERWARTPQLNGRGVHRAEQSGKESKGIASMGPMTQPNRMPIAGLKSKDLVGIPWRVAFALQADGWYLRSDIIWSKPNPMPESVTDRPTKAHEYLFLLTKSERYFYDKAAIAEPVSDAMLMEVAQGYEGLGLKDYEAAGVQNPSSVKARIIAGARRKQDAVGRSTYTGFNDRYDFDNPKPTRNRRTVWTIPTMPYAGAHFATMPEALVEPCIVAGSRIGDLVFDPFLGSGTVGAVAERLSRRWVGTDLTYQALSRARTAQRGLMF